MRQPGDRIGRYVIVGLLGQGGMGEVYEAEDSLLGRRVALKLIVTGADAEMRERMLREARTAASFEHPNVVVVFDVGVVEDGANAGETFLAMELVRGKTLRSMVRDKEVPLVTKLRWLIDVARALDAAHAAHLVHRDIKPDNLMIRDDGQIKVLDFGIAKKKGTVDPSAPTGVSLDPQTLTKAGAIVGTPRYASPEQLRGDALDGRSDQYAWGVTAYELISGRTPFETDDPIALLSRVLSVEPAKLRTLDASIPEVVEAAIHRTMAKRAEDRFALLEEAAELLEPYAAAQVPSGDRRSRVSMAPVKTPPPSVSVARGTKSPRVVMLLVGIGLFVAAIVIAVKVRDRRTPPPVASEAPAHGPLQCSDAKVSGPGSSPGLAHMFGIGACARLGVSIGEAWTHDKAVDRGIEATRRPVSVVVGLGPRSTVTLTLGKEVASSESTSPLEAMQDAVSQLAAKVPARPLTEAERAEWGASTDESARRIERFWRRLLMQDMKDPESDAKALTKSDPDSPWPYAFITVLTWHGSKTYDDAVQALEARLDRVSGARQRGLRALALLKNTDPSEAMRELRKAYGDAPDDADIAGLYAALAANTVSSYEGFAVVDRLAEQFPTHALLALSNAISTKQRTDLDRDARYLARLGEVFPESQCSGDLVQHHLAKGELDAARAVAAECDRFGTNAKSGGVDFQQALIALSAEQFDVAREIGVKGMGDPRSRARKHAADLVIGSLLAAGRVVEAEETLRSEYARQRDEERSRVAIDHAAALLKLHRRLGTKAPAEVTTWLTKAVGSASMEDDDKLWFEADVLLAQGDKQKLDELIVRMRKDDPSADLSSLPFVRARKGDRAAAEMVSRATRASDSAWRGVAIDAALALEATHADSGKIQEVLGHLKGPDTWGVGLLDIAIGEAILARVCEAEGKHEEAKTHATVVARRLAKADKGVAETIAKIR